MATPMRVQRCTVAVTLAFLGVLGAMLVNCGPLLGQDKSLLWQVRRDGNSIYLLGSIHYLRPENYPLNAAILEALDTSKKLVLEIDLNSTPPEAAQRAMLETATYRDGTTLAQRISAETYQGAARRAAELGVDFRLLNPMKPWFAAMTLLAVKLQRMGLDSNLGVDRYLADRAKKAGKPTMGLETMKAQVGILDALPAAEQELMLREAVEQVERLDRDIDTIVKAWLRGDSERLASLLNVGRQQHPELHEKIVVERNRRWLGDIERLVHTGSGAMVVVGAAHLVGKQSLVELLKAKDYSVEQR